MSRSRLLLFSAALIAAFFAGCNPAAKAIGKWAVETDKLKLQAPASGDNAAAAVLASMSLFVQVRADIEIQADQTWRLEFGAAGNTQSQSGTWQYARTEGDTVVLLARPSAGEERELKLKFVDDDHVEASGLLGNQVFPLQRQKHI